MKARVKGTTDIIEVEFDRDALNACYTLYYDKEHDLYYHPEQLEWVENDANAEPDYWTRLEHQAAIVAMQGILSNPEVDLDYKSDECMPQAVAATAYKIARALVEKMKEERK